MAFSNYSMLCKSLSSNSFYWCDLFQYCSVYFLGAFVHVAFASPALVSTVGKLCLVAVTVQGAPHNVQFTFQALLVAIIL